MAFAGTSEQNRSVGFRDACNGVPLNDGHTSAYIEGYNEGKAQCGHEGPNSLSGSDSASSSFSSSSSNGNTLNIHIDGAK